LGWFERFQKVFKWKNEMILLSELTGGIWRWLVSHVGIEPISGREKNSLEGSKTFNRRQTR
jgi:hypothetical protein